MPAACRLLATLCTAAALLAAPAPAASIDILPPELERLIKKNRISKNRIGLLLARTDGTMLAAHRAEQPFNPASVAKIITALAAVDLLGATHKWQTTLATRGRLKDGVLHGDLYLIGGGDPTFTTENLLHMLSTLRSRGVRDIRGDLIIDDSVFALPPHDPAAFDGAATKPYNVGAHGMIVNFKVQRIVFTPSGGRVRVYTDPPNAHFAIDSRVKLSSKRCRNWRGRIREQLRGDGQRVTLRLTGAYSQRCKEQAFYLSVLDPLPHTAGVFTALWQRLGGSISGGWRRGTAPEELIALVAHESDALPQVLADMNKFSNNVIARNLFLSLAGDGAPATPARAQQALQQWLHEKGVPGVVLENGSGLSRTSRITPAQMTDLLTIIWRHPYRAELVSSLPILGEDGTLRKRRQNARGSGHLKTGSLDGITTISGFFRDQHGRHLMFTLFGEKQSGSRMRRLQADIINWAAALPQ